MYGYPKAAALQIAVREIAAFLAENDMTVYVVVFTGDAVEITGRLFGEIAAYIDDVYVETHYDADYEARRSQLLSSRGNAPAMGGLPSPKASKPGGFADRFRRKREAAAAYAASEEPLAEAAGNVSLDEMLARMDEGFPAMLLRKIDERRITDAECYKRANIDRRLFNKIKNNPGYRPGKQTVLAFAIALELSLDETREMLAKAGYSLTRSSKADIVVEYCILRGIYDIIEINQVLFKLDLQPLGY